MPRSTTSSSSSAPNCLSEETAIAGGASARERVLVAGGARIDLHRRIVERDGQPVCLTRTEWLLLQQLAANTSRVMTDAELLSKIWGAEYRDDVQYLRVWVSRPASQD